MNHLSDKILNRVRGHGRGKWVCTPKDFLDLGSRPAVQQALSGPVNQGHLHRAGRGLYHLPRMSKILKRYAPPSQEQIVAAIARRDGIRDDRRGPLFRSSGQGRRQDVLPRSTMTRQTALKMIKRRVRDAGLPGEITNHSFRGTGITEYLRYGGVQEIAARIAGHESTRTTQLYNRTHEELSLDEVERIHI